MSSDGEPTGLIATKGIEILTGATPNGQKAVIMLEELKEAYGKDYTWQGINIGKNTQKQPWFTALNPNGRIPVIVDHDRNDFAVMEGSSILQYLTRHYDPEHKFNFEDPDDFSVADQWATWAQSGLAPMQGQSNHFVLFAKETIPYAIQRYVGESERLIGIIEKRLESRDYLAGPGKGKYSIADIVTFSWVNFARAISIDLTKQFKNVAAWVDRINARPAVKKALAIPNETPAVNANYLKKLQEDPEFKAKDDEKLEKVKKAKEQYNYKYASP